MICKPMGRCLNDEWGAFLKQHGFLIGLSIDGPKELHDRYRLAKDGMPTFNKVYAAAQMLQRHKRALQCALRRQSPESPSVRSMSTVFSKMKSGLVNCSSSPASSPKFSAT